MGGQGLMFGGFFYDDIVVLPLKINAAVRLASFGRRAALCTGIIWNYIIDV